MMLIIKEIQIYSVVKAYLGVLKDKLQ